MLSIQYQTQSNTMKEKNDSENPMIECDSAMLRQDIITIMNIVAV